MSKLVEGKVALITGSSSGIGRGIALVLAREGADVIVNYCSNAKGGEQTVEQINTLGQKAIAVKGDVGKAEDVGRLYDKIIETFGRIDILVNNAGITSLRPFLETDENFYDKVFDTDVKGTYLCSKRAAELMKEQGYGRIINISSIHDKITSHDFSIYASAKAAVSRLTTGMAVDLAEYGITVNAISPGWIPVETEGEYPPGLWNALCSHVPLSRPGTPEDVGELAAFLASDKAKWLTGQTIYLDGGMTSLLHLPSRKYDKELFNL